MDFTVDVNYNSLMFSDPEEFSRQVSSAVNESVIQGGYYLMGELMRNTPVGATANMRRNWKLSVSGDPNSGKMIEVEVSNDTPYLKSVNDGRKAGPISAIGMKSLQLWVKRKLSVSGDKESMSVAYKIAAKKKKYDTPGQGFVQKTAERAIPIAVKSIIEPALNQAIDNIL